VFLKHDISTSYIFFGLHARTDVSPAACS